MFADASWVVWVAVAFALGALEAATVDHVFLMLAGGAVAGALAAGVGQPFAVQAGVAVVVSILLLRLVRPRLTRRPDHRA
ncbi:MAG TPA: hypothetical protein P5181_00235 [Dermatophilaceae bacterium]|nr:hypothetical protein [Dermatophilaceae bacterium]